MTTQKNPNAQTDKQNIGYCISATSDTFLNWESFGDL